MMQITYNLELRQTDTKGYVEMPVRITFYAAPIDFRKASAADLATCCYEWTMLEIPVRHRRLRKPDGAIAHITDPDYYDGWIDVTPSPSHQELVQIEYDSGRLFDVMDEHYRNQAALERAQVAAR